MVCGTDNRTRNLVEWYIYQNGQQVKLALDNNIIYNTIGDY
jgi:hypothetical protein